ncbi:Tm-1-like ATP-binding domain-containing protein [Rhodopirellula sp. MGV]|uniref:Tm-1-like ATP-binding domain-containing protein n=1 Tax=Rhodopirellula sp. MGV TaxID=2023130 RepID=UPI000B96FF09|nr:Tm-1-like ATP-binding domain-containing protein [Rhodopirellula sp. MGV]OYP29381.1 hypothetical protein CGZ80_24535 [Rhodopirellula sp. MGV]PNY35687.1 UPF0261 family protein [Rhodopirellula baltica]
MEPAIYAIATMDTKGIELDFVAQLIRDAGVLVRTLDVGTMSDPTVSPDVDRATLLGSRRLPQGDRGEAIKVMSASLRDYLVDEWEQGRVAGVIGLGGSGGTSLITQAMRALPIGLPKLMVSTVASGNTAPYVDCSDITMMFSVVDVAGLNVVSKAVFANAAGAIVGMVRRNGIERARKQTLAMTMFGVTTPCVTSVREAFEMSGYDCLVFHATGTGGRAMERLVGSGMIDGVLDITTTEVADQIAGGVFPCGEHRFEATLHARLPLVLSLGALDMVNFGTRNSVPDRYQGRLFHVHNEQVTLMRTDENENRQSARWIADKLNRSTSPLTVVIPEGGVSALDAPGQAFYNPEVDRVLFDELEESLLVSESRRVVRSPFHINDPEFAACLIDEYNKLIASDR